MKSNDRLTTSNQNATQYSTDGGSDRSSSLRHSHKRYVSDVASTPFMCDVIVIFYWSLVHVYSCCFQYEQQEIICYASSRHPTTTTTAATGEPGCTTTSVTTSRHSSQHNQQQPPSQTSPTSRFCRPLHVTVGRCAVRCRRSQATVRAGLVHATSVATRLAHANR